MHGRKRSDAALSKWQIMDRVAAKIVMSRVESENPGAVKVQLPDK
jgi:hypothetical protein